MGIAFGGADVGVTKEGLDVAYVGAAFQEVGGEGVAKAVNRNLFGDTGVADGFVKDVLGRADCEVAACDLAWEKPFFDVKEIVVFG